MYLAAMNGHLECAKFVAQNGAQKDRADKIGRTPLLVAALNGHLDLVRYLVETGATKCGNFDIILGPFLAGVLALHHPSRGFSS